MAQDLQPALGVLEFESIAIGILAGDAMVKQAPVVAYAGTVHPGKYIVAVGGDVASVEEALAAGREAGADALVDDLYLPDAAPQVIAALGGAVDGSDGDALGIFETRTVASLLGAADRAVKGAVVSLRQLVIADGLGGKAYCLFQGDVADVEEAVALAEAGLHRPDLLVARVVVPRLHEDMLANLTAAPTLLRRLGNG